MAAGIQRAVTEQTRGLRVDGALGTEYVAPGPSNRQYRSWATITGTSLTNPHVL